MRISAAALLGLAVGLEVISSLAVAQTAPTPSSTGEYAGPGGLRLAVPPGWEALAAGDKGVVLRPLAGAAWPIEVVAWPVPPGGEASPAAAAAAQETALCRLAPYARSGQEAFTALDGRQGLLITGQVRDPDGQLLDSVFVAYASTQRFAVVGTFGPAGTARELVGGDFGVVARSLSFDSSPAPPARTTPLPVLPTPAPLGHPPATTPPLPAAQSDGLPILPPASSNDPLPTPEPGALAGVRSPSPNPPPPPAASDQAPVATTSPASLPAGQDVSATPSALPGRLRTYVSPTGYRLDIPGDWQVRLVVGRLEAVAGDTGGAAVPRTAAFFWPWMRLGADQDPLLVARHILRGWDLVGGAADGLAARRTGEIAVLAGTVGRGDEVRRLVACCSVASDCALLSGFICEPQGFVEQAPLLVQILASFSGGPWWAGASAVAPRGRETWVDPDQQALQVPAPPGWKLRGKLQAAHGLAVLNLEGLSADQSLRVGWYQPVLPLYRELTQVLANLGWREGDRYQEAGETAPLRVMPRLTPKEYLTRVWLAAGPRAMQQPQLDMVQASQEVAAMVAEGEGLVVWARDAAPAGRQRLCLVATGLPPGQNSAGIWQASVMECEAPEGQLAQAVEVLRSMVEGAEQLPGGDAQVPLDSLAELLRTARAALMGLGAVVPPAEGAVPVLARLRKAGQGSPWVMPALALEPWQRARMQLQSLHPVGAALPELTPGFWK
ncbi:MAG: hypothetical protein HPY69_02720 [Armatimonadetes bacterium]|nr:hypothetical protein [Armatimonadota bacterium]